jgi:hypothetical protein
VPQLSGELHNELWAAVGDVLSRGSVVPPHILVVQPGGSDSTEAGVALVEVGPFTEDISHNHDCCDKDRGVTIKKYVIQI